MISAHKSVAELGVIGRAEDMHRIMDAERDATLAYLDDLTRRIGGRRGRGAVRTPTEGLIYATTRHATSRAGDPCPHDHVLVANLVRMDDDKGGWKAADTALWREHLHAATMFGRMASAQRAVELGYGIVADDGPSGKLGHWAIAGVPEAVMEVHSKRAAEIEAEMDATGHDVLPGPQHRRPGHPRPQAPHAGGRAAAPLEGRDRGGGLERRAHRRRPSSTRPRRTAGPTPTLSSYEVRGRRPGGPGRRRPAGRPQGLPRPGRDRGRRPAPLRPGSRRAGPCRGPHPGRPRGGAACWGWPAPTEPAYATATTIAREEAIARSVESQASRRNAACVSVEAAQEAVARAEERLARPLTAGQRQAVEAMLTSGRGVELVVGVAGSGKTTALAATRDGFEAAGYEVVGTSTSGQAARTLDREAGIDSRHPGLAQLAHRAQHPAAVAPPRGRARRGGHDRRRRPGRLPGGGPGDRGQGGGRRRPPPAVLRRPRRWLRGPGLPLRGSGARAERERPPDRSRRARDPAMLRSGDVEEAVAWYARAGRISVSPDRDTALDAVVAGWAADVSQGAARRHVRLAAGQRGRAQPPGTCERGTSSGSCPVPS